MSGSELLVHIGYHKTGTTWLQHRMFNAQPFAKPLKRTEVVGDFVRTNAFLFDAHALVGKYAAAVDAARADGAVPVLSSERLSGSPHSGGYDARAIANRLVEVVPNARILIVIRRQHEMLASVYKQYVKGGGAMSCRQYATPPRHGKQRVPLFHPNFLEYHHLIAYYQRVFPDGAVLVLPYEQLLGAPDEFCAAIGRHVDADIPPKSTGERVNASSSALAVAMRRQANRLLVRDSLNPAALFESKRIAGAVSRVSTRAAAVAPAAVRDRAERSLDVTVSSLVRSRYAESNSRTATLTGLDLAGWGYEVASS